MSSSDVVEVVEDDDVQFICEGPLRPVLEYIDLSSDDGDRASTVSETIEDQIDKQKAQVASTLDRLARQVAVEKQERADKCKAFRERLISQQAHGCQELAFSRTNRDHYDAKRCVDMWLKMPGPRPGGIYSGAGWRRRSAPPESLNSSPKTCPVLNCGRVYDNAPLLEGHLKRFDHSPCDPTIRLKGSQSVLFACIACGQHFRTKDEWKGHLESKVSLPDPGGHASSQTCQLIVCYACPACYLLFNIRDECLQHMSAKSHFTESIRISDSRKEAVPIPITRYAKNRLIALCKEVGFCVRCSQCKKILTSHMEARAHFSVHCRQASAIAEAEKTVAEVMQQLAIQGHCSLCPKVFHDQGQMERHRQATQHEVELFSTMKKAILLYSNYQEMRRVKSAAPPPGGGEASSTSAQWSSDPLGPLAKRQRLGDPDRPAEPGRSSAAAWFCECGLRFSEEALARKHLHAANQVFHKCGVCGKLMGESSIANLHMSRFHGGAHLSNILFHCRKCQVDMPRLEDIMSHVGVAHEGHTFYQEREDVAAPLRDKASTSREPSAVAAAPRRQERWLCRMCAELFDSEAAVKRHCGEVGGHSFQRFACPHCPQKFFKEDTLRRHCWNEHEGRLATRYFCGLCDGMQYDTEREFLRHYRSLHATDYCRLDAGAAEDQPGGAEDQPGGAEDQPGGAEDQPGGGRCPCMAAEMARDQRKAVFTGCMKALGREGRCSYSCGACQERVPSYSQIKAHVHTKHGPLQRPGAFSVTCGACAEEHPDVPAFHAHYHARHCPLEPCGSSRSGAGTAETPKAEEMSSQQNEFADVKQVLTVESDEAQKTSGGEDHFDEDLNYALALSAEEAKKPTEFDMAFRTQRLVL
uniref:C2H2-type domain-containing protein n=1 Tax=Denticeps clupeoides TaxID=299321 RepID=A0AAY4DYC8_9TELE